MAMKLGRQGEGILNLPFILLYGSTLQNSHCTALHILQIELMAIIGTGLKWVILIWFFVFSTFRINKEKGDKKL